jgi:hypothetical protein
VLAVAVLVKLNGPARRRRRFAAPRATLDGRGLLPSRLLDLSWLCGGAGCGAGPLCWWVRARFGHLLLTDRAWQAHSPQGLGPQWPTVLLTYASYLALLLGPLALLVLWRAWSWPSRRTRVLAAVVACVAAVAPSMAGSYAGGEMGYGSFDRILPGAVAATLRAAGIAVGVILLADMLWRATVPRAWCAGLALATVVPYLTLSSFSRPAQRYADVPAAVVLFDLIMASPAGWLGSLRKLCAATIAVFGGLSLVASVAIAANGRAAEDMTDWIQSRGWIAQTELGALRGHTAHRFPLEPPAEPRFVVVRGDSDAPLHQERILVVGRALPGYSLVEKGAPAP